MSSFVIFFKVTKAITEFKSAEKNELNSRVEVNCHSLLETLKNCKVISNLLQAYAGFSKDGKPRYASLSYSYSVIVYLQNTKMKHMHCNCMILTQIVEVVVVGWRGGCYALWSATTKDRGGNLSAETPCCEHNLPP